MEQLMQRNAEAEQPELDPQEMGIASNPIPERNYAGGGIVAFAEGGTPEEQRRKALEALNINMPDLPADYRGTLSDYLSNPEWAQAYEKNQQDRAIARRAILENNPIPAVNRDILNPSPSLRAQVKPPAPTPAAAVPVKTEPVKTEPGVKSLIEKPTDKTKAQSPLQKATGAPEMPETKVDPIDALIAKYEKMIAGDPEASTKARKEAMWNRLAEAGLNIMGGTSSNFAQNVALASPAIKGYGEDVKGIRVADNEKLNQLAGLGLKGVGLKQEARKLGITEQHYKDWLKVQTQQNAIQAGTRADANATRADTAMENRIKGLTDSLLKLPKYTDNPELAYADATKMVTGKSGQNQFAGYSGRPLK
jgi:hypothetical protein